MITANHSKYWLSKYVIDTLKSNQFDLFRLANIKQAITNYTKILSKKDIDVVYSDLKKSHSTKDNIIVISNECESNIDLTVGIAMHEIMHLEISDFNYLLDVKKHFPQEMFYRLKNKKNDYFEWLNHFKFIINLIEDYRINANLIKLYPGYAPYINEINNVYAHNETVSNILSSLQYRDETWDSYLYRTIYHENLNSDLLALKKLKDIINLIDVKNILRLKNTIEVGEIAKKVLIIIFEAVYVDTEKKKRENKPLEPESKSQSTTNQKNSDKKIEDFIDFINGNDKKKTLKSKEHIHIIDLINETKSQYVNVELDNEILPVLVINTFNKSLINNSNNVGLFTQLSSIIEENQKIIQQGINLGRALSTRLECLNDIKTTKYSYLKKGKIDNRLINTLGYNNNSIFYREEVDEIKTINLHISIDMSGSMVGKKIHNSLISAISMAYVASVIDSINVLIDFRFVSSFFNNKNTPCVLIAYDSKKDTIQKIKDLFKYIYPTSATPEGLCFAAILDIIKNCDGNEKYFINFSDGMPSYGIYNGKKAITHTKQQVDLIRKSGVKILSYYITHNDDDDDNMIDKIKPLFIQMYGEDAQFIDVTNILQISKTLNKKFLE